MAIEESEEVKKRNRDKHNGGVRSFFDPGRATRNVVDDSWTLSYSVHDDMINRGYKIVSVDLDESGFFLTAKFVKRDDYVP